MQDRLERDRLHHSGAAHDIRGGYFYPAIGTACPTEDTELQNSVIKTLSSQEAAFIGERGSRILPHAWSSYLQNVKDSAASQHIQLPGYVSTILSCISKPPQLAIATSGGGHRAAIFGAGVMAALDGRNSTSASVGTGGLLQASSYLAGLSGGSWLVGSLTEANFPIFPELIFGSSSTGSQGWLAQFDLTEPSSDPQVVEAFIGTLVAEVAGKFLAGFPITINDVWARTLSRHFVSGTTAENFFDPNVTHGAGKTLSGLADVPAFSSHAMPFPIITSDSLSNTKNPVFFNQTEDPVSLANVIYEFTPYEMGSYDPTLSAFTPTKFLGSPNNSVCVTGFDQLGFIEGSSSELFNEFNTSAAALAASPAGVLIGVIETTFNQSKDVELDATLIPNPFAGVNRGPFPDADSKMLRLVDGGEDGQIMPIQPLLVKARDIDTIIAIDAPADTDDNFSAGFSLIASQQRASLFPGVYSFPPVPKSVDVFISQGLAKRPTFFGCNSSPSVPLIIYIANGGAPLGQAPVTNTSTLQTTYQPEEIQGMLNQVFDIATQGIPVAQKNGQTAKDPEFAVCLACAVVDKQRSRSGIRRSGVCESCLQRYCWS
ncbi:Lysophospholipase 1 [Steccherinum ochraceum]|uniref:Lysophospholipase n=1 Tax=Steccherinum ochraceum TaxID=92696 RepID=A0A4R0RUF4_9APHY|nr:Lysophospholipase 1 [Steccherinum ochraceum]